MSAARHRKFPDRPARSLMRWSMVFRGRAAALRRHPSLRSKDLHCESIAIAFASRTAPSRFSQAAGSRSTRRVRGRLQAAATSMIRLPKSLPISWAQPGEQSLGVWRIAAPDRAEAASYRQLQFDLCHVAHRARYKSDGFNQAKSRSTCPRPMRRARHLNSGRRTAPPPSIPERRTRCAPSFTART
jgi:hypothetical protein